MGFIFSGPLKRYVIGESYSSAIYLASLDLVVHIIKMKAANTLSVQKIVITTYNNTLSWFFDEDLSEHKDQCKIENKNDDKEVSWIEYFALSCFDTGASWLTVHMRNETILKASKLVTYGVELPMFSYMLKS